MPVSSRLLIVMAAFVVVGGYLLISHSFAASNPPQVASYVAGMCLDDYKDNSANGAIIDLFTCNGTGAQQWTKASNGQIMIHGKCLDVYQQKTNIGASTDLFTCKTPDSVGNQTWSLNSHSQLVSKQSGLCLGSGGSIKGAVEQLTQCSDITATDEWTFNNYNGTSAAAGSGSGGSSGGGQTTTPGAEVASGIAGKCLDDYRDNSADRAKVDIFTCNNSDAQHWSVDTDGLVKIHGKCLDVYQQGTKPGSKVELFTCNSGTNQIWNMLNDTLVGDQSKLCLEAPSSVDGTQLVIDTCKSGQADQKWYPTVYTASSVTSQSSQGSPVSGTPSGTVSGSGGITQTAGAASSSSTPEIASGIATKCLDDLNDDSTNGTHVDIDTCNGTASQHWLFANNRITINGKCLDVYQQNTKDHAPIDLYTCKNPDTAGNQTWTYDTSTGAFKGKQSGRCLDDPHSTTVNGTQLQLFGCNGTPAQQWTVGFYSGPNPFAPKPCPTAGMTAAEQAIAQFLCPVTTQ